MIEVCFVEIRAGFGGGEASAWAEDLAATTRAYLQRSSFLCFPLYERRGAAGLEEVIYLSEGANAYERLRFLDGVHRRVRIPPGESRRHAAFAHTRVMAHPEALPFELDEVELRLSAEIPRAVARHPKTGLAVRLHEPRVEARLRSLALNLLAARVARNDVEEAPGLSVTLNPEVKIEDPRTGFSYAHRGVLEEGDLGEMAQRYLRAFPQ